MYLFSHTERYYDRVARPAEARAHATDAAAPDERRDRPGVDLSRLTERAMSAALSLGGTVIAVAVAGDEEEAAEINKRGRNGSAACRSK